MPYSRENLERLGIHTDNLVFKGDFVPYNPDLVPLARELRTCGTTTEAILWNKLKHKQTGYKFTRQKPILDYIVDFYCHELKVVVEVDGGYHNSGDMPEHDTERDRQLKLLGLTTVRLLNSEIITNPVTAVQLIFVRAGIPLPEVLDKTIVNTGEISGKSLL